jgi:type III pantothenate kinase
MKEDFFEKNICLVVDGGNTSIKLGIYQEKKWMHTYQIREKEELAKIDLPTNLPVILSSVRSKDDLAIQWLLEKYPKAVQLNNQTPLPYALKFSPDTGADRIALCVAARALGSPNQAKMIIGTGTCITYNYLSADGEFLGGAISPGLEMRLRAMHHFTGRLPLVSNFEREVKEVNDQTEDNMLAGALFGLRDEIEGRILRFTKENPKADIFVTGGGYFRLVNTTKYKIFADQNLLLDGLRFILEHNHSL